MSKSIKMRHASDEITCPILDERDNYHFEMRCEDCDVQRLSRMNLGDVEDRYRTGRITQDEYEAYCYVWALLSPTGNPDRVPAPEIPAVRRIARKLLRARGFDIPTETEGEVTPS